ncbi:phosphopantetheine-binding protein [Niveibacterium sp. SC-1]|uniref:phosphopantetheine-binding protein n=1 Tax=Niveibacterium sp. SC-1 TaxID=3135646 RepID=UPI00312012B9
MDELYAEIKQTIIESLDLEEIGVEDIDTHAPLFGEGLGLDSIDALELGVALQRRYGVVLSADSAETKQHFASVAALAELVRAHRAATEQA